MEIFVVTTKVNGKDKRACLAAGAKGGQANSKKVGTARGRLFGRSLARTYTIYRSLPCRCIYRLTGILAGAGAGPSGVRRAACMVAPQMRK